MSSKAAPRLLRAVVSAVESATSEHLFKFQASRCSRAFSIRSFASVPGFAPGHLKQHRGSGLHHSSRQRFSNATPSDEGSEGEDEASEALATTLLKLQHDALEMSGNGHPEKCAQASTEMPCHMPLVRLIEHALSVRCRLQALYCNLKTPVCLLSHQYQ